MRLLKWTRLVVPVLALAAVALVLVLPNIALGDEDRRDFTASLNSFNETPTLSTNGNGTLRLRLTPTEIQYTLTFHDLSSPVKFAHIHLGENHTAGGVIAFLCGGGNKPACMSPISGKIEAGDILSPSAVQLAVTPIAINQGLAAGDLAATERAIRAGAVYGNVHTNNFPAGEIRGQLRANDR